MHHEKIKLKAVTPNPYSLKSPIVRLSFHMHESSIATEIAIGVGLLIFLFSGKTLVLPTDNARRWTSETRNWLGKQFGFQNSLSSRVEVSDPMTPAPSRFSCLLFAVSVMTALRSPRPPPPPPSFWTAEAPHPQPLSLWKRKNTSTFFWKVICGLRWYVGRRRSLQPSVRFLLIKYHLSVTTACSALLHVNRDRTDYYGHDVHLDFHTAPVTAASEQPFL